MHTTPTMISVPKGSKPLSAAHIALVKLLARIAVEDYLQEVEHLNIEQSAAVEVSDHAIR